MQSIIIEAANEAGRAAPDFEFPSHLRELFPAIITDLGAGYGAAILHSIEAILRFDTSVYNEEYHQNKTEEKATIEVKTENKGVSDSHQSYLDLLKRLDDKDFAREFTEKKLDRATDLLNSIFMVTSGCFVEPDNKDWAHENIIELLTIFQIKHENFDRGQFAEDLQGKVYLESFAFCLSHWDWEKKVLAKRGLNSHGIKLEESQPLDSSETSPESLETIDTEETLQLKTLANQVSEIMNNPLMPTRLFSVMADELNEVPSNWRTPEAMLLNLEEAIKQEKQGDSEND